MATYPFREKVKNGFLLGMFVSLNSPALVESLGTTGFDFVGFDAEHAPFGIAELENLIRAADIAGLPALVRVPEVGPYIGRVLDLGAAGVIVPRVETADQAREVVGRVRYPPDGYRGAGAGRAAAYGGSIVDHVNDANRSLLAIVQIETEAGLAAAEDIAAIPGIDGLLVGPFDLSISLGCSVGSPAHTDAMRRIFAAANRHNIAAGTFCMTAEQAAQACRDGLGLAVFGLDRIFLVSAATEGAAAVRAMCLPSE